MAKAIVTISAEDKLTQGLNEARKSIMKFEQNVQKAGDTIAKAFHVTTITAGIVALGKAASACISEFSKVERVSSRLGVVWSNVGAATGMAASELEAYADAIEQTTYFEAEAVKEAALLLAATESLTEDGFKKALDASIDLAEAMGTDVSSAASTLAKALQDPEAGLSRLKSIGVSFTDAEKDMIKGLQEEGKTWEAQQKILDKVEQKYQGIAQAVASTPTNTLKQISNTLGDIKEDLGQGLVYALEPAFNWILARLKEIHEHTRQFGDSVKLRSALKEGGSLSSFSTEAIEKEIDTLQKNILDPFYQHNAATFRTWISSLEGELDKRAKEGTSSVANPSWNKGGTSGVGAVVSKLEDFLKSYGKSSTDYQKQTYLEIIKQAEELQKQMTFFSDDTTTILRKSVSELGLDTAESVEDSYNYLAHIISSYNEKILNLGKKDEDEKKLPDTFLDNFANKIGGALEGFLGSTNEQASYFASEAIQSFLSNVGEAGEVIGDLASNMATMGAGLGALYTAFEYVMQGIGETIAPVMNLITELVIKPLVELGKAVGSLLLPILNILVPVLKMIIKPVIAVVGTFQYVGQVLQHWVASIMNWLAGLNIFGWHPFGGLAMYDPGSPGNYFDYIGKKLAEVDSMTATSGAESVSTSNAISSAGYRGATQVTINIYQEAPVVGDGGMREFAQMIKEEFDNLNYYGVTA